MNTAAVALLALLLVTDIARIVQRRRHPVAEIAPAHRYELTTADGRSMALQSDKPLTAEAADRMKRQFYGALAPPAAPDLLAELVKLRYVVTLRGGEGDFAGILTDQQVVATPGGGVELMLVFEHCKTMPTHEGDTADDIAGRVILGMSGIAYLQQVG